MIGTITKTYESVTPATSDYCCAEVHLGDDMVELCSRSALLVVVITTIALNGRKYVSRVGFCNMHMTKRYRRWFKMLDQRMPE